MYKLWDMSFLFWSGFCMAESWVCRLSLCLACKPFPGLCACTQTSQWCTSGVVTRSLSLFTNWADRCSQISSLDFWCATRVSKTLDIVHRYPLLVSNSDYSIALLYMHWMMSWSRSVYHWLPPAYGVVPSATCVTVCLIVCLSGTAVTIISLFLFS